MYIRQVKQANKKTGQVYVTHRLVEAYRNQDGKVRQQGLLNLGSCFPIEKKHWKLLADRIEEICCGQKNIFELDVTIEKEAARIAKLITKKSSVIPTKIKVPKTTSKQTDIADIQAVDVNSLSHDDIRKIGAEHVGLFAAHQLQLPKILTDLGLNRKQINLALATIIGRLVHPGSELRTHHYLTNNSALDELLETDFSVLPLKNLYMISDVLLKHKLTIEEKLYTREKNLFDLEDTIILYDLTNTYFEGHASINPKAQRGRSKEKRNDCHIIALGLVLDSSGFPKKSTLYPGNVSEPSTLQEMLAVLTDEKVTVVMDAGIATEKNIEWLKAANYQYIVVSRKAKIIMPENELSVIVKATNNNCVQAILSKNETTDELELYCHSTAKEAKTKEMVNSTTQRYETELKKLAAGIHKKRGLKAYSKLLERLGRLKEKYKRIAQRYEVIVEADDKKMHVTSIQWKISEDYAHKKPAGTYCLRTNRTDLDAKTFWDIYTMLTEVESSFRSLKSELGFRPIYHQKENRVDGHLFISILAYHLLHTIRYQLKLNNIQLSWQSLRDILETHCRITSTLQLENGKTVKVRKTSSPTVDQTFIYEALKIASHPGRTEKTYY